MVIAVFNGVLFDYFIGSMNLAVGIFFIWRNCICINVMRYVVSVSSYIRNEDDYSMVRNLLEHLRDEGIDVIFCTHSKLYLSEVSELCKYVYYDSSNIIAKFSDYIENASYLDDKSYLNYGHSWLWHPFVFGEYSHYSLNSPHTPACLKFLKMGLSVAKENDYEYMICLEADGDIPTCGFRKMIEDKLQLMISNNNGAYCITHSHLNITLYTTVNIVRVADLYGCEELYDSGWESDIIGFIKTFGYGHAEKIIKVLLEKYVVGGICSETLKDVSKEYYDNISFMSDGDIFYGNNKSKAFEYDYTCLIAHLVPYTKVVGYGLMLLCYNNSNPVKFNLNDMRVYKNGDVIHSTCVELNTNGWYIYDFGYIEFKDNDLIKFEYEMLYKDISTKVVESFYYYQCKDIHDKVMRLVIK